MNVDISHDLLFPVAESLSPRLAWQRRVTAELVAWQRRVTAELGIFTHHHPENGWMAFSHVKAVEFLGGDALEFSIRIDPFALFSNFCRLLDEAGMVADGEETEFDAVVFVAMRHGVKLWNEESP